jgi:tryptophan synthase alpha chain
LRARCKTVGADGVLITDLVPEEAGDFRKDFSRKRFGFDNARRADFERRRLKKICEKASGFVYAVSRAGVTGARNEFER